MVRDVLSVRYRTFAEGSPPTTSTINYSERDLRDSHSAFFSIDLTGPRTSTEWTRICPIVTFPRFRVNLD